MFARTALTGLLVAAVIAICPALAQAVLTPTLTMEQGAGTTAGTSPATGFNINFNPRLGVDSVKNLSIAFPPGFLLNLGMNSGECVTASAPNPLCVLGTRHDPQHQRRCDPGDAVPGGTADPRRRRRHRLRDPGQARRSPAR